MGVSMVSTTVASKSSHHGQDHLCYTANEIFNKCNQHIVSRDQCQYGTIAAPTPKHISSISYTVHMINLHDKTYRFLVINMDLRMTRLHTL